MVQGREKDTQCPSGPVAEISRQSDSVPQTTRLAAGDGEAMAGRRTLVSRGGLSVLGGVRAWWSKSDDTTQSCADSWRRSFSHRRCSAQEEISVALTRVSLVSIYLLARQASRCRRRAYVLPQLLPLLNVAPSFDNRWTTNLVNIGEHWSSNS